ncbi:Holliday junction branch migration DNA helicase RuvB, partial [bacterium]
MSEPRPRLTETRITEPGDERSLRPQRLEDFVGQERVKKQLRLFLDAALQRGEVLDHVLFYGPPGM